MLCVSCSTGTDLLLLPFFSFLCSFSFRPTMKTGCSTNCFNVYRPRRDTLTVKSVTKTTCKHATDLKWNNHHLWNFWLEKMVDKVKFVLKNDSAWILQVLAAFSHHHNQRMNRFNLKRKCTVQLLSGFHGSFNRPYLLLLVGLTIQGNDCHVDKMM